MDVHSRETSKQLRVVINNSLTFVALRSLRVSLYLADNNRFHIVVCLLSKYELECIDIGRFTVGVEY